MHAELAVLAATGIGASGIVDIGSSGIVDIGSSGIADIGMAATDLHVDIMATGRTATAMLTGSGGR